MSDEFSPELRAELLDDFYAECDELLTSARDALIQLEKSAGAPEAEATALEALFRHMHSLKGISAIVGLRPAEQLAHGMEDVLRALTKRTLALTAPRIDVLLVGAQRFEQLVIAHRGHQPLPDTTEILQRLRSGLDGNAPAATAVIAEAPRPAPTDPVQAARELGLTPYNASFLPTAELSQRGINVNLVRERLQSIGKILSATPSIRGPGSIAFEFVVGVEKIPSDLAEWERDGIQLAPVASNASQARPADAPLVDATSLTPSHVVRVDLARLDDLMRITGEMVINRLRLEERINQEAGSSAALKEINLALARSLREMRETISRARLVPIAEIFARVPFVVRDLARDTEKKARVALEGQQTEVDKYLVERLKEPLLHLVRNAFAHGVESPAERAAAGKPPEATILLRARSEGSFVVIQIRDDGRGVDSAAVVARATALGVPVPERVTPDALLKVLCAPGFSTREEADLAAGRGVGMSVVANVIRELGGTITLETQLGAWTQFTLKVPLTLSIADAIIVKVGSENCAVPQSAVDEIIQVAASEVRWIQQTAVIPYRGALLPLVYLRKIFRLPEVATETVTLLVLGSERGAAGLVVDGVRGQREIVIRPLSDPLLRVPGFSGTTDLGDGRPLLILDSVVITQGVVRPPDILNTVTPGADVARAS